MSAILPTDRLTTTFGYNKVPAVEEFGLPALQRDHSANAPSQVSSKGSTIARDTRVIDRAEPCFVTKRPSFTLERAHWVNVVRKDPVRKAIIEAFLWTLGVVHNQFNLNDATNLTNLDRMLHVMLDKFGFFAVTPSLTTLQKLISLVEKENRVWQSKADRGNMYVREFDFFNGDAFVNAQYELVALHPEHFLPKGSNLTVYTHSNGQLSPKSYVVGGDRTLRESPGTLDCPRLPAFDSEPREEKKTLNVFLIVLNAEIKFRRYRRMGLTQRLPDDVENLIDWTIKLADLIYWRPAEQLNPFHQLAVMSTAAMQVDTPTADDVEMGFRTGVDEEGDDTIRASSKHRVIKRPGVNATMEEQREYAHYLLSGDDDLDSDDQELLEELGLVPEPERPVVHGPPIDVGGNIREWRQALEVH